MYSTSDSPTPQTGQATGALVEFCTAHHNVDAGTVFHIGRTADLDLDDNPYLHRRCLSVHFTDGLWWLSNTGTRLPVTVSAVQSGFQALLVPGTRLPLIFGTTTVILTAGPTTYEFAIHTDKPACPPIGTPTDRGDTTIGTPVLTTSQLALIVALAEPLLAREGTGASAIPSSAHAAARLGWPLTTFNRKLDNVCDKFARVGVRGLHGGPGRLATNRRVRLVEFAVASRLVTKTDLCLIAAHYGQTTTGEHPIPHRRDPHPAGHHSPAPVGTRACTPPFRRDPS